MDAMAQWMQQCSADPIDAVLEWCSGAIGRRGEWWEYSGVEVVPVVGDSGGKRSGVNTALIPECPIYIYIYHPVYP